jgi:hypothetical protein
MLLYVVHPVKDGRAKFLISGENDKLTVVFMSVKDVELTVG